MFTKITNRLEGGITVKLLLASGDYDEFETLRTITANVFFEYSNFRKNFVLEIAEDTDGLKHAMQNATHVQVNDVVYVIDQGDTTRPMMTDVTWKLYCNLNEDASNYS